VEFPLTWISKHKSVEARREMMPSSGDPSPFLLAGGPVAALLIHGFTGSPSEMRLLGNHLNRYGLTVLAPLLPGHGTQVEDLNQKRWRDWLDHVVQAYAELASRCELVFVGGESLGSLLALQLASRKKTVAGAILLSPAIKVINSRRHLVPLLKYVLPKVPKSADFFIDPAAKERLWAYDCTPTSAAHEVLKLIRETKRLLAQVTCPVLVMHSTRDPEIHPASARYVYDRISSTDKKIILLHNSGHVLALDSEWETVAENTYQFIYEHLSEELQSLLRKRSAV
jgi:carboxylesterase